MPWGNGGELEEEEAEEAEEEEEAEEAEEAEAGEARRRLLAEMMTWHVCCLRAEINRNPVQNVQVSG